MITEQQILQQSVHVSGIFLDDKVENFDAPKFTTHRKETRRSSIPINGYKFEGSRPGRACKTAVARCAPIWRWPKVILARMQHCRSNQWVTAYLKQTKQANSVSAHAEKLLLSGISTGEWAEKRESSTRRAVWRPRCLLQVRNAVQAGTRRWKLLCQQLERRNVEASVGCDGGDVDCFQSSRLRGRIMYTQHISNSVVRVGCRSWLEIRNWAVAYFHTFGTVVHFGIGFYLSV